MMPFVNLNLKHLIMVLESEHTLHPDVHPIADNRNGDDMGSEESQTLVLQLITH